MLWIIFKKLSNSTILYARPAQEDGPGLEHLQKELSNSVILCAGLHKLWYPGIRDTRMWSKFEAHGEHGDVFLFSNLGAL